jgi:hypothetical protein
MQLDFVSLSYLAEGYTPADIRGLVDNAMQGMLIRMMEGSPQVSRLGVAYYQVLLTRNYRLLVSREVLRKMTSFAQQKRANRDLCET